MELYCSEAVKREINSLVCLSPMFFCFQPFDRHPRSNLSFSTSCIHIAICPTFYDSINLFQIWVYGNSFESYLIAVVNPNQQVLEHWAEQNGITGSFAELCKNSRAKEHILSELTKIAKEKKVNYPDYDQY